MSGVQIRPATADDVAVAADSFPDLCRDRWREGGNRRSFVAVRAGVLVGHARGIDNASHPGSRVTVLEVAGEGDDRHEAALGLLARLREVSDRPLHLKIRSSMVMQRAVARVLGGLAIQAMPPWRYPVLPQLRAWAVEHRAASECPGPQDAAELLDLLVQHYLDQHAAWSPADGAVVRREFAGDVEEGGYDRQRSVLLRRDGKIVAAALVWPGELEPWGGVEVSLVCERHGDPAGRVDMEVCLAGVIDRCGDEDVLLIDSHVTERVESTMMRDVPGPPPFEADEWTAIVAIPGDEGPAAITMPTGLIPAEGAWIEHDFTPQ